TTSDIASMLDIIRRQNPVLVKPKPIEPSTRSVQTNRSTSTKKRPSETLEELVKKMSKRVLSKEEQEEEERAMATLGLNDAQIEEYNAKLGDYYRQCEEYLKNNIDDENACRRTFPLSMFIENNGKGPASDIDVYLTFLPGFGLGGT